MTTLDDPLAPPAVRTTTMDDPLARPAVRNRQRQIAGSGWWTGTIVFVVMPVLHFYVVTAPAAATMADRLAIAVRCAAIAVLPYMAVCSKIMLTRFLEGAHDPLSHIESATLKVDCRVMQNHLEQTVAFTIASAAIATLLPAGHLQLLPITTVVFVVGRLFYWWGYHREGTLGRAPGVQLTFGVTIPLTLLAAALVLRHVFSGAA